MGLASTGFEWTSNAVIINDIAATLLLFNRVVCDLVKSITVKKHMLKIIKNSSGVRNFRVSDISFSIQLLYVISNGNTVCF